jgi:predicted permease
MSAIGHALPGGGAFAAQLREHARLLWLGLGYKLLVCPALVVALLWAADAVPSMTTRVSVIEAAMPPMIGAAVVAAQSNLSPKLLSMMVGLGISLSMLTVPGLAVGVRRDRGLSVRGFAGQAWAMAPLCLDV